MTVHTRLLTIVFFLFVLVACSSSTTESTAAENSCPLTEAVWAKPPEDAAVLDPPAFGYFVNEDNSIWASAWWMESEEYAVRALRAGEAGNKIGWFRPEGADLVITGRRLDAKVPPLMSSVTISSVWWMVATTS